MLTTPFGTLVVTLDGQPVPYTVRPVDKQPAFAGVDGVFLLCCPYEKDGASHNLRCFLDCATAEGGYDGGERLEAITMDIGQGRLTIGWEGEFGSSLDYDCDGQYLPTGLEICIGPETKNRDFLFGVAWMERCASAVDAQTWLAADPARTAKKRQQETEDI